MSALLSVQRTDPTLPITQFIFKVNTRQIQCKMRNLSSPTVSFSAPKLLGKPWLQNLGQQFFLRFKVTQPKTARIFSYLSSSSSAITSYFPSEQSDNNSSELHQWLLRWRIHCRFLSLNWIAEIIYGQRMEGLCSAHNTAGTVRSRIIPIRVAKASEYQWIIKKFLPSSSLSISMKWLPPPREPILLLRRFVSFKSRTFIPELPEGTLLRINSLNLW